MIEINDNNQTCEICLENYDYQNKKKLPKILNCCSRTICLECLNDIYNRNGNKIVCPICRKITYENPQKLKTNKNVLEGYLNCLNCGKKVIKSELFLHLDTLNLRCKNCQNNDFPLNDYIPEVVFEITNFIKDFKDMLNENEVQNKNKLIMFIEYKIHKNLQEIFQEIENLILIDIRNKIIKDIINKLKYNPTKDFEQFYNDLKILKDNRDYLESFIKDDTNKKFSTQKIQDNLIFISLNLENIRREQNKYSTIMNLFNQNKLLTLKEKIKINEIGNLFNNILDTILSDYDNSVFFTGIEYFDNMIGNNSISKKDFEIMEKNYKFQIKNLENKINYLKSKNVEENNNKEIKNKENSNSNKNEFKLIKSDEIKFEYKKEENLDKNYNNSNKNKDILKDNNNSMNENHNKNNSINKNNNKNQNDDNEFELFQSKRRNNIFNS